MRTASGEKLNILVCFNLEIIIAIVIVTVSVIVANIIKFTLVLGNNFLTQTGVVIDFGNAKLFVNPKFVVKAAHGCYILPASERCLKSEVTGGITHSAEGIIYGHRYPSSPWGTQTAVKVSQNHVPVVLK